MAKSAAKAAIMFEWEGKNSSGNKQKGIISSPNAELVKAKLRRQGIIPSKIRKKRKEFRKRQQEPPDLHKKRFLMDGAIRSGDWKIKHGYHRSSGEI